MGTIVWNERDESYHHVSADISSLRKVKRHNNWLTKRLLQIGIILWAVQMAANGAEIIFPQVARGVVGNYIETVITVVNPQADAVTVHLESFGVELPQATIKLQPGEVREIRLAGSQFQAGWVALRSDTMISATANILTKENPTSSQLLSQITILGQPLASKFVVPVFRNTLNVDNTGVAVAIAASGKIRLTLRDESGETIAVRNYSVSTGSLDTPAEIKGHLAVFLSDIFSLPSSFTTGSLTIEQILPERLAQGFSAVAIYTKGSALHASPIVVVDRPSTYSLALRDGLDPKQVIQSLASQYGFFIGGPLNPGVYSVTMSEEVSRAVARDPRVAVVARIEDSRNRWRFEFENGTDGWSVGFADLPVDFNPDIYELHSEHTFLPVHLGGEKGIFIQGHNRSDDLFMFAKKRIDGLKPNTIYKILFEVEIATQAPRDAVGAGGPPGEGVWFKVGASLVEPERIIDASRWYRMNIDKGNQSQGGKDAVVIGNVAKTSAVFSDRYELKSLNNLAQPFSIQTDATGTVWLLVGTDSGFEGKTSLYYNRISVVFYEQ